MLILERIEIVKTDITTLAVDAIVNAANTSLMGGGGVDGAIHRAAGPRLLAECLTLNGCATGAAKITDGYNLPAKHVIHTVGPVWAGGRRQEAALLSSCYLECLKIAEQRGLKTIAFPAISCGVYGFPIAAACTIAVNTVCSFLERNTSLRKIIFACFNDTVKDELMRALLERVTETHNGQQNQKPH